MILTSPFVCFPAPNLTSRRRSGARETCSSHGELGIRWPGSDKSTKADQMPTIIPFPDRKVVLLTQLCKGQHATVLQLPVTLPVKDQAQKHGSFVGSQSSTICGTEH